MNPMVDMAFLLVTFFLLASTFKTAEPAKVVIPRSVTNMNLPNEQVITLTITNDGRTFIGISEADSRKQWLKRFSALYDISLTEEQEQVFQFLPGFGVPSEGLSQLLSLPPEVRNRTTQSGIPVDSLVNELTDWIVLARAVMPRARIAIKSDRDTPYKYIENTIKTLTDNNILRFNLMTEIKRYDAG
jgi:biopolymer transport protein ExbD